ncbi:MAG: DUF4184 family protein [Bacteroidia bacterium]
MPFTFSHPAIVLPFAFLSRNYISMTGLIIGSLAPDFEYFIRFKTLSLFSHTIPGIFYFNLPVAIILAFLFHHVVRNPLIDNLPLSLKSRFIELKGFNWKNHFKQKYLVIIISIIIGAASHIFWDAFTHRNGYFVYQNPILLQKINVLTFELPLYNFIQHLSTITGGIVVLSFIYFMKPEKQVDNKINSNYWIYISLIVLIVIFIKVISGIKINLIVTLIVTFISSLLIALTVAPLLLRIFGKLK